MSTKALILSFLFILNITLSLSAPDVPPPTTPVTPTNACNSTMDPTFCQTILPPKGPQNLKSFSRFCLAKSISNAQKFLDMINQYLYLATKSQLSITAVRALEDCQLLSGINIDFINSASATLNTSDNLVDKQTDQLQTLLSALITNQQTCFEGLQATASAFSIRNGLSVPLKNGTKLYSTSLSLFNSAFAPRNYKRVKSRNVNVPGRTPKEGGRKLLFHEVDVGENVNLPLKMSSANRALYERRTGRKLLQASDAVLIRDMVVVSQDGTGNFTTISEAVSSAPNKTDGTTGYYLIYVNTGVYEEHVNIPKKTNYIMMIGDGINQTVVTGNRNNVDGWTTFNSATLAVVGQGFVGINMTFQNTAGPSKHQAVAVRNGADLSTFYSCSFEGYQDTLYAHSMRQFYKDCDIYGTVDFIFGNAAVVFQDCNIYSRLPMQGQKNTITAQGRTDPGQNTGISIQNCTFLAADELAADNGTTSTYLGRPWKLYSRTVIMQSFMDSLIDPAGWLAWDGDFALSTLYYAEYDNNGPGSDTSKRVTWAGYTDMLNATDAVNYTVMGFVFGDNWLPQTGVPYSSGLLT